MDLAGARGTHYTLESMPGLSVVNSADDWTMIGACESRSVVFQFTTPPGSPAGRSYALSADLWFAVRGSDQAVRVQTLSLYLKQ